MDKIWKAIRRTKTFENDNTQLHKCLSTLEILLLGMGSMIGSGIYVITGVAAKEKAGPGIIVSFVLAAIVIGLSALCYVEFAARIHKTGGIYIYTYMCLGELPAFLVGLTTVISISLGGATNARAWSSYLDSLLNYRISNWTMENVGNWTNLNRPIGQYPDFAAGGIILILTIIILSGVNCSGKFISILTILNVSVLIFVSLVGFITSKSIKNWTIRGFMPFGINGVISGSTSCFWAFSGFESLFSAVEEAKNPKRSIPLATGLSILFVMIIYILTSMSITLMIPYYDLNINSPIPSALAATNLNWAKYIGTIGPLFGLTTSLFSSLFVFIRQLYAIGMDGLLPEFTTKLSVLSKIPIYNVYIISTVSIISSVIFDLRDLMEMAIVISLSQYLLVSCAVLYLRYQPRKIHVEIEPKFNGFIDQNKDGYLSLSSDEEINTAELEKENMLILSDISELESESHERNKKDEYNGGNLRSFFTKRGIISTLSPGSCVLICIFLFVVISILIGIILLYNLYFDTYFTSALFGILITGGIIIILVIVSHVQANVDDFVIKTPCVPIIPCLSILANSLLMVYSTGWSGYLGYVVFLLLSLVIYFSYGLKHSKLNENNIDNKSEDLKPLINVTDNTNDDDIFEL